ncbi:hypothetical protein ACF5W4_05460 [Bacillota bacterium Lsc_1132]
MEEAFPERDPFGGIIGTFHHLYFSGLPTGVIVYGAAFSALEVVPLVLIPLHNSFLLPSIV